MATELWFPSRPSRADDSVRYRLRIMSHCSPLASHPLPLPCGRCQATPASLSSHLSVSPPASVPSRQTISKSEEKGNMERIFALTPIPCIVLNSSFHILQV